MSAAPEQRRGSFSLLWPDGDDASREETTLPPDATEDLALTSVLAAMADGERQRKLLEHILLNPTRNCRTIRYRQEIMDDLLRLPALLDRIEQLMPMLEALAYDYYRRQGEENSALVEVTWRLGELENVVACVSGLGETFAELGDRLRAEGWQRLRQEIEQIAADDVFRQMAAELPALLEEVRASKSITVGVNLDHHLQPVEATLLSVNDRPFRESSFLSRLLPGDGQQWRGIAPLHERTPPQRMLIGAGMPLPVPTRANPMLEPLFRDLAKVLNKVCQPIARTLEAYKSISARLLVNLYQELVFYLAGVRLVQRLQRANLPVCQPQLVAAEERVCQVQDAYNVALALSKLRGRKDADLQAEIVTNPIFLDPEGRIQILTGPNQGGKTTYLQAVGLIQVLAQTGLPVPGSEAILAPVDGIYTHFPAEEQLEKGTGRFGEEARRLKEIFREVTPHSLLLFNEPLTSTSFGESLYLAQDLIRVMRRLGLRAIFTTHMHELADSVQQINEDTEGDARVISIVASRIEEDARETGADGLIPRSYEIRPGPPVGRSFARDLAQRYGISHRQLLDDLQERGLLTEDEQDEN